MNDTGPSSAQLRDELKHENYKVKYRRALTGTVAKLAIVAAVAVLVAVLWMPVLQIYGSSMTPALIEGDIIVCRKTQQIERGDLIAFYYGNKLLVKRCIALPGDIVKIDDDGNVFINGELLDEPYVTDKSLGHNDIEYPYAVPQERYFLLGDHRVTSEDSRSNTSGCVSQEQLVGRVLFRVWPLGRFGTIGGDTVR